MVLPVLRSLSRTFRVDNRIEVVCNSQGYDRVVRRRRGCEAQLELDAAAALDERPLDDSAAGLEKRCLIEAHASAVGDLRDNLGRRFVDLHADRVIGRGRLEVVELARE